MKYPITLRSIRDAEPCVDGWENLLRSLGYADGRYDPERTVTLGDVARSNGAENAFWCARCLPKAASRDLVRSLLPTVQRARKYKADRRAHTCIAILDRWLLGEIVDLTAASTVARMAAAVPASAAANAVMAVATEAGTTWASSPARATAVTAAATQMLAERARQVKDIVAVFGVTEAALIPA